MTKMVIETVLPENKKILNVSLWVNFLSLCSSGKSGQVSATKWNVAQTRCLKIFIINMENVPLCETEEKKQVAEVIIYMTASLVKTKVSADEPLNVSSSTKFGLTLFSNFHEWCSY